MHIDINGTRLWFDVDGVGLEPSGATMVPRPTFVLLHGGPGSFDHSYFKPWFSRFAERVQVVFLDLRGHGRSARGPVEEWTFERCADDVRAFCDALGIERPVVLGHSLGGFIAILYGARHPGQAAGLVLLSTFARFDIERIAEGFRSFAGDDVGALARRSYAGDDVTDEEWARVFEAFGPNRPSAEALARRVPNAELNLYGGQLLRELDIRAALPLIADPTLVVVGDSDPLATLAADELMTGLRRDVGRLEAIPGAGHFPWLDEPARLSEVLTGFVEETLHRP